MTTAERFWAKVRKTETCWLWTAHLGRGGYAHFTPSNGVVVRAHRYAYKLLVGPIPAGLDLDHLCRVRHCVRPDHLEPVTRSENLRRGYAARGLADHCHRGHLYTVENTRIRKSGARQCRACARQYLRDFRAKNSTAALAVGGNRPSQAQPERTQP